MRPSLKYAPIIEKAPIIEIYAHDWNMQGPRAHHWNMRPSLKYEKPAPACRTPVRRGGPTSCRGIPIRDAETGRAPALRMTRAWRVAAAAHRARTPSQPARHTRRRQAQLIGSLRPWDGYPAAPSPPRLPPDGASTSLPVYQSTFVKLLFSVCPMVCL